MSLTSWMAEFYPESTRELRRGNWESAKEFELRLIDHSIKKWEGALPENIEKHGLIYMQHIVIAKGLDPLDSVACSRFSYDTETCSLCKYHYDYDFNVADCVGKHCPIIKITEKSCIDAYQESVYDPSAMLKLLKTVREGVVNE